MFGKISKKSFKRIALGTSLFLISGLVIAIIIMASVQLNFFPYTKDASGNKVAAWDLREIDGMTIYDDNTTRGGTNPNPEAEYLRDIPKLLEKSFKASFLTSSAAGAPSNRKYSVEEVSTSVSVASISSQSRYVVFYRFGSGPDDMEKYIKNPNGTNFQINRKDTRYYGVVFAFKNGNRNFGEVEIYFATDITYSNLGAKIVAYADYTNVMNTLEKYCELWRETPTE